MQIQPYLFFEGRCEEAAEFYQNALGAQVTALMRFKESPDPDMITPGTENKIMHMTLLIDGTTIMASDGRCQGKPGFEGFALSITPKTDDEAERRFNALADGGQVQMPLAKTFFATSFGMVSDRFGVPWMVVVPT